MKITIENKRAKKKKKQIIELLKSGNFSIITWDNDLYSLYEGRNINIQNFDDKCRKEVYEFESSERDGYCDLIVTVMAEALGGNTSSI
jgi:hypothetical protein